MGIRNAISIAVYSHTPTPGKLMDEDLKICQKRRYETEEEAREMIKHIISFPESPPLETYKCHVCHNYHLTSKKRRTKY